MNRESHRTADAPRVAYSPTIFAHHLVDGIAGLAKAVNSDRWNRRAKDIEKRLGDNKTVPLVDVSGTLDLVWFIVNKNKKTGFDPTDIRLSVFFAALQECVILPFGEELMRNQLERIDREQKIMVNMAEKAKAKGEPVESLLSMAFYC